MKDGVIHMLQHLAGMDERVDNSCKGRAEYLCRSLVIVYTWSVAGVFYMGEVSVHRGG